jgi:phosphohistidine phosphatase
VREARAEITFVFVLENRAASSRIAEMQVLLVRHGTATSPDLAPTDEMRWLTSEGRAGVRHVGRLLKAMGLTFTRVYTSPLVRAVQTAELLAQENGYDVAIEAHGPLSVDFGSVAQALLPLDRASKDDLVVLVTHEPKIRSLAGHLTGVRGFPGFSTGGACLVDMGVSKGAFRFMLDPQMAEPVTTLDSLR